MDATAWTGKLTFVTTNLPFFLATGGFGVEAWLDGAETGCEAFDKCATLVTDRSATDSVLSAAGGGGTAVCSMILKRPFFFVTTTGADIPVAGPCNVACGWGAS